LKDLRSVPMCGRCGKRCDRLTEWYDEFCRRLVFVAHCHGERERVDLGVELFDAIPDLRLDFTVAFQQQNLLEASH